SVGMSACAAAAGELHLLDLLAFDIEIEADEPVRTGDRQPNTAAGQERLRLALDADENATGGTAYGGVAVADDQTREVPARRAERDLLSGILGARIRQAKIAVASRIAVPRFLK